MTWIIVSYVVATGSEEFRFFRKNAIYEWKWDNKNR